MFKELKKNILNKHFKEVAVFGSSTFVLKIVGLFLSYLVILFVTKNYGADIYGKYSLSIAFSQIITLTFTLGLPILIVRIISDKVFYENQPKANFLKKINKIVFIVGLLLSGLVYVTSDYISIYILKDQTYSWYLKTLSFFILPLMFHEVFLGFFKGKKDFFKHNLFLFILPPIFFFLFFILLKEKISSEGFVFLCYLLSIALVFLIELFFYLPEVYKSRELNYKTKILLKDSFPMMYSGLLLYLLSWTDIFMIENLRTSKEVGIYTTAFKVASIGFLVITSINVVIAPKIAELYSKKDIKQLHKTIVNTTRLISVFTLPLVAVMIFFRKEILSFFGAEFIAGENALILIALGILFSAMSGTVDQILNMTNQQKVLRNIILFSFVLNVVLNYLLIPKFGIEGAAFASLITNVFLNSICIFYIRKKIGFYTFV
ncbi:MAG: flippase [Flavobacteriaceae bacterium]